jgi:hypothetical protein
MILPRTVRAAYERALALQPDHDAALLAAAQALGVTPDLVREALETEGPSSIADAARQVAGTERDWR